MEPRIVMWVALVLGVPGTALGARIVAARYVTDIRALWTSGEEPAGTELDMALTVPVTRAARETDPVRNRQARRRVAGVVVAGSILAGATVAAFQVASFELIDGHPYSWWSRIWL